MQAFAATPVSKDNLIERLHRHRENDSFRRGQFWNDITACKRRS